MSQIETVPDLCFKSRGDGVFMPFVSSQILSYAIDFDTRLPAFGVIHVRNAEDPTGFSLMDFIPRVIRRIVNAKVLQPIVAVIAVQMINDKTYGVFSCAKKHDQAMNTVHDLPTFKLESEQQTFMPAYAANWKAGLPADQQTSFGLVTVSCS